MTELKKLVEAQKRGSGRQNRWQHCTVGTTAHQTLCLTEKQGHERVGTRGGNVGEISRGPDAESLVGELLKGFEQESNKLWFTFSKATLAASK